MITDESGYTSGFETTPSPQTYFRAIDLRQSCGHLLGMIQYLREATGETLEEDDAAIYEEIGADYSTTPDQVVSASLWDQLVVLSGYHITRPPTPDHEFVRVCNGDLRKMVELMQRTPQPETRSMGSE